MKFLSFQVSGSNPNSSWHKALNHPFRSNRKSCFIMPITKEVLITEMQTQSILIRTPMVFAPKETASSIGWEKRSNSNPSHHSEKSQKRNVKKKKEQPKTNQRNNEKSDEKTATSKKRARTSLHGDFSTFGKDSCINGESRASKVESYYGPQLPSDGNCQPSVNANLSLPSTEPSQEFKISENSIGTVVTFDGKSDSRSQRIAINGRARVEVIEGSFDILGYRLSSSSNMSVTIDSPNWMSAICIEPLHDQDINSEDKCSALQVSSRIQISSLSTEVRTFELSSPQETRSITITEKWKNIAAEIIGSNRENPVKKMGKILVCGAKGTGKSTFCRYLANRLLSVDNSNEDEAFSKKVAILDCDVGQSEFSTPGVVSLTLVSHPILSPPHAHIVTGKTHTGGGKDAFTLAKRHERSHFFGFTTSKANPVRYMSSIRGLLKDIDDLYKDPGFAGLVVNTDGWVKGMGYEILSTLISTINPGHIVQILGSTKAKFFDLAPHVSENRTIHVAELVGGKIYDPFSPTPPLSRATSSASMQSLQDASMTDTSLADNLAPIASSLTRSLRLLTYFLGGYESFLLTGATFDSGGLCDDDCNIALKLSTMKPFMVPFESVECTVLNEDGRECAIKEETLYDELNSSIVALCGENNSPQSLRTCHGLGIVRSIDRKRRLIFVLTPVDASTLQSSVTSIVKGQLQLPLEGVFSGVFSEAFPFISFDGTSVGIGNELMKSKNACVKK